MGVARHSKPVQSKNPGDGRAADYWKEIELAVDGVEMGLSVRFPTPQGSSPVILYIEIESHKILCNESDAILSYISVKLRTIMSKTDSWFRRSSHEVGLIKALQQNAVLASFALLYLVNRLIICTIFFSDSGRRAQEHIHNSDRLPQCRRR